MDKRQAEPRFSTRARVLAGPAALALGLSAKLGRGASAQEAATVRLRNAPSSTVEDKLFGEVLDAFRAANPNIKVDYEAISGDYETKLQTDLAAGNAPDVFYVGSLIAPDLMASNQLLALDDRMAASGVKPTDYYPGLIQSFQWQGKTYGLPKDFSPLAMVYDKKAFADAGIAAVPTTWDELRAAAQTLKDKTGQPQLIIDPDPARELAFHYAAGGKVISDDGSKIEIDTPEGQAALDFWYGLYRDGLAATHSDAGASWAGDAIAKGLAAIVFEGNWFFPFAKENAPDLDFGIAELPAAPGGGKGNLAFTVSWSASANTKVPDAAYTLISYICGPEGMAKWTSLGLAIPSRPDLSDAWLQQFPERQPYIAAGDYSRGFQFGVGGQAFINDATSEMQGLFAGKQDVATTLQKLQQVGEERIQLTGAPAASPVASPTS